MVSKSRKKSYNIKKGGKNIKYLLLPILLIGLLLIFITLLPTEPNQQILDLKIKLLATVIGILYIVFVIMAFRLF